MGVSHHRCSSFFFLDSYADETSSVTNIYFVSFVIIVTLLFSNLFFGMILSIFARIYEDKHEFHGYRLTPAHLISILDRMSSMPAGGRHPMASSSPAAKPQPLDDDDDDDQGSKTAVD